MLPRKGGFGVDGSSGGSGCFGTEFCFQGRERRLEQIRAKEKIKKKPKGGVLSVDVEVLVRVCRG